jgi:hypothetical protein
LMFLGLTRLSHPHHFCDFFNRDHSAGHFLENARRVTEKMFFDGLFWGKLPEMNMIVDRPDGSAVNFLSGLLLNRINRPQLQIKSWMFCFHPAKWQACLCPGPWASLPIDPSIYDFIKYSYWYDIDIDLALI